MNKKENNTIFNKIITIKFSMMKMKTNKLTIFEINKLQNQYYSLYCVVPFLIFN